MQLAGLALAQRRGVAAGLVQAFAGGLDADQVHTFVAQEGGEDAHGVGASAHAGGHVVRQAAVLGQELLSRFRADDGLEVTHHFREGVRARRPSRWHR